MTRLELNIEAHAQATWRRLVRRLPTRLVLLTVRLQLELLRLTRSGRLAAIAVGVLAGAGALVLDLVTGAPWWRTIFDVAGLGYGVYLCADFLRRFRRLERHVDHLMGQRRLERFEVGHDELSHRLAELARVGVSIEDLTKLGKGLTS